MARLLYLEIQNRHASDRYVLLEILYVRDNPLNGPRQASLVK